MIPMLARTTALVLISAAAFAEPGRPPAGALQCPQRLVEGIGTRVKDALGDGTRSINTRIDGITCTSLQVVNGAHGRYHELRGTISGIGWGGLVSFSGDPFAPTTRALGHYRYDGLSWVLRWPDAYAGDLVIYNHGADGTSLQSFMEALLGPANPYRHEEDEGLVAVAEGVVQDRFGAAYFAVNTDAMRADGTFAASYSAEVDASAVAVDGTPVLGMSTTGPFDAAIGRDVAVLGKRLAEWAIGRGVRSTLGVGSSGGSNRLASIAAGSASLPIACEGESCSRSIAVRAGDNHTEAYAPCSGRIYDGFLLIGYAALGAPVAGPTYRPTAPLVLLRGQADDFYGDEMDLTAALLDRGVDVNRWLRIVHVGNMGHYSSDMSKPSEAISNLFGSPTQGDQLRPLITGLLGRLRDHARDGRPLPGSLFDPAPAAVPVPLDPAIDSINPLLTFFGIDRPVDAARKANWDRVVRSVRHEPGHLVLPESACRVGGFMTDFSAALLMPFPLGPETRTPAQIWGSLSRWQKCVRETVEDLSERGYYDRRLGLETQDDPSVAALFQPVY